MKKLMIAATIAAMAGASFAADSCGEKCTFGYRLKVMVRTTVAKTAEGKTSCDESGCFRMPTIRRFIGFVYGSTGSTGSKDCCDCNKWSSANVALWDFDASKKVDFTDAEIILLDRIGYQDTSKCEMCFQLDTVETCGNYYTYGSLVFSGFGGVGKRAGNVTVRNVAGYCAGWLPAFCSTMNKTTCKEECSISRAWDICTGAPVQPGYTAAYGKWTLVWDDGAAAQVGKALAAKSANLNGVVATPVQMGWIK